MQTVLRNHSFVGARTYEYDFQGETGRVTGVAYYIALVEEDPLGFPVEVKVTQDQYERVIGTGFGAMFDARCETRAKNNKIQLVAESITDSQADPVRAVS